MSRRNDSKERAISPVIGSVLLIAIVVIVMATFGAQVLTSGIYEAQPEAELVFDEDSETKITIGVKRASGLVESETTVRVQETGDEQSWVDGGGESGEINPGDTVSYDDESELSLDEGNTIQVISSDTLIDDYELKNSY